MSARTVAAAIVVPALILLLLIAYAAPRPVPLRPAERLRLEVADFRGPYGASVAGRGPGSIEVRIDDAQAALPLSRPLPPDAATRYRFATVSLPLLPMIVEAQLRLRRGDGSLAVLPLPHRPGPVTVDLARFPQWQGDPRELVLEWRATDLMPADALRGSRVGFGGIAFESDALLPAVSALFDEWFALRPWTGRSINTAGLELGYAPPRPLVPFLAIAAVLVVAGVAVGRRWPARRWGAGVLLALGTAWLLLDLVEIARLAQRTALVEAAAARAGGGRLAAVPALAEPLRQLGEQLAAAGGKARIVVLARQPFLRTYVPFQLLPLDAAAPPPDALPELSPGTVVLRLEPVGELDEQAGELVLGAHRYRVSQVSGSGLPAWRIDGVVR